MATPPPQVVGGSLAGGPAADPAAQIQRQMALAAAQQGARHVVAQTRSGILEIKAYIQENPTSVKVACFIIGLVLIVFSILGCFNLFGAAFEPKEYLNNLYNVFFGIIICLCDGKESWMNQCFNAQEKLFRYAYLLATQTGRALFYFYVGSMTILVLPDSWFWAAFYISIGACLCLLALLMLLLQWCGPRCQGRYGQMSPTAANSA